MDKTSEIKQKTNTDGSITYNTPYGTYGRYHPENTKELMFTHRLNFPFDENQESINEVDIIQMLQKSVISAENHLQTQSIKAQACSAWMDLVCYYKDAQNKLQSIGITVDFEYDSKEQKLEMASMKFMSSGGNSDNNNVHMLLGQNAIKFITEAQHPADSNRLLDDIVKSVLEQSEGDNLFTTAINVLAENISDSYASFRLVNLKQLQSKLQPGEILVEGQVNGINTDTVLRGLSSGTIFECLCKAMEEVAEEAKVAEEPGAQALPVSFIKPPSLIHITNQQVQAKEMLFKSIQGSNDEDPQTPHFPSQ